MGVNLKKVNIHLEFVTERIYCHLLVKANLIFKLPPPTPIKVLSVRIDQ